MGLKGSFTRPWGGCDRERWGSRRGNGHDPSETRTTDGHPSHPTLLTFHDVGTRYQRSEGSLVDTGPSLLTVGPVDVTEI